MKNAAHLLAFSLLLAGPAVAQTTGHIQYEVTKVIDPNQMRVMINGQVVKPGSPDFPTDIPTSSTLGLSLTFAGSYAREERESNAISTTTTSSNGVPGVPQTTITKRPFEETTYLDLAGRSTTTLLTLKKDNLAYRSNAPYAVPSGWKLSPQTKKIAGYLCHKATVAFQKETYTVWYTTDLPFTYSPKRELMPERGVVLALESEKEQYQATKTDTKAVPEAEVRPTQTAQTVTPAEMKDLREKAMADFRQQFMQDDK